MTKKQSKTPTPPEDVIDAEFEPVEESRSEPKQPRQRPAWPLVWGLFIVAIFAGGLLGIIGGKIFNAPTSQINEQQLAGKVDMLTKRTEEISQNLQLAETALAQNKSSAESLQTQVTELTEQLVSLQSSQAEPREVEITTEQVDDILSRLQQLENRPLAIASSAEEIDLAPLLQPFEQRLSQLENKQENVTDTTDILDRLQTLEQQKTMPAKAVNLDEILNRLDSLETGIINNDQSAAKKLVLADLKLAVQGSEPFPVQYAAMDLQYAGNSQLQQLSAIAATGAPTRLQLAEQFQTLIPEILLQVAQPADDAGLGAKAAASLRGLVVVRRTDGKGSLLEITLDQVQNALDNDDLDAAILQMQSLAGAAAKASENWLQQAMKRQKLEQVVNALLNQQATESEK
ncbi:MAG: hypothetical protein JKY46_06655 [Robiginitomaculum sp.]|nr:hypothetical protein [Robiginitomaculum sp.]